MTTDTVVEILRQALLAAFWIAAPLMAIAFAAGVAISLAQIVTSIQDTAFSTIPRVVVFVLAILLLMPWMIQRMVVYTTAVVRRPGALCPLTVSLGLPTLFGFLLVLARVSGGLRLGAPARLAERSAGWRASCCRSWITLALFPRLAARSTRRAPDAARLLLWVAAGDRRGGHHRPGRGIPPGSLPAGGANPQPERRVQLCPDHRPHHAGRIGRAAGVRAIGRRHGFSCAGPGPGSDSHPGLQPGQRIRPAPGLRGPAAEAMLRLGGDMLALAVRLALPADRVAGAGGYCAGVAGTPQRPTATADPGFPDQDDCGAGAAGLDRRAASAGCWRPTAAWCSERCARCCAFEESQPWRTTVREPNSLPPSAWTRRARKDSSPPPASLSRACNSWLSWRCSKPGAVQWFAELRRLMRLALAAAFSRPDRRRRWWRSAATC